MKHIVLILLSLCCIAANAQNAPIRRNTAKKIENTSRRSNGSSTNNTAKKADNSNRQRTAVSSSNVSGNNTSSAKTYFSNGVLTVNGARYPMVKVYAGSFTMGATSEMENPWDDEKPTHKVTLTKEYYMGKTEVTQALWKAVMGSNPSYFKGDNKPVENVSWNDCQTFISKLNSMTGKRFRLPTEAEWEFAARGGNRTKGFQYCGSNSLYDVAWFTDNSSNVTHDVATKQPNELGLYDMSGNVWEWCADWYGSYSSNAQYDPVGPSSGSLRVLRGGSWYFDARNCRSSRRDYYGSDGRNYNLGLRLVLSDDSSLSANPSSSVMSDNNCNGMSLNNASITNDFYFPEIRDKGNNPKLFITKVHIDKSYTIVDFMAFNNGTGNYCGINKNAYLLFGGIRYPLQKAEGIAYVPNHTEYPNWKSKNEVSLSFKLYFSPLPNGTKEFDFIEPSEKIGEWGEGWTLKGVKLDNTGWKYFNSEKLSTSFHYWECTAIQIQSEQTVLRKRVTPKVAGTCVWSEGDEYIEDADTGTKYYLNNSSISFKSSPTILYDTNPINYAEVYPALPSSVKRINIFSESHYYIKELKIR